MLDGRALAEEQILPSIRGGLYCHNPECFRGYQDSSLLQHLLRTGLLPRLPQHLVATRERELAVTLTRERTANHQQATSDGHQRDDYGRGVVVTRHLHSPGIANRVRELRVAEATVNETAEYRLTIGRTRGLLTCQLRNGLWEPQQDSAIRK
jgi:hypothetical protein